jgi:hypothetical protein
VSTATKTNTSTTGWPEGYNHFYTCQREAIFCTRLWRYVAGLSELDAFERETDATVAAADAQLTPQEREEKAERDKSLWEGDAGRVYKTHFALFRRLGANGWPANFLVVQGKAIECSWDFEFQDLMPALAFDVAIVENASAEPVRIEDLLGAADHKSELRPAAVARNTLAASAPLGMSALPVPAHSTIIVPLRIVLMSGLTNPAAWGSMADARKTYGMISAKPRNALFSFTGRMGQGRKAPVTFEYKRASSRLSCRRAPSIGSDRNSRCRGS